MRTNYEQRLKIPILGNPDVDFSTKSGLRVATGYTRIVIGGRGPYIEFSEHMMNIPAMEIPVEQEYRLTDKRVYYIEYRTLDIEHVKVYLQVREVAYADYKIGMYYISPFDLMVNGIKIIEKLK